MFGGGVVMVAKDYRGGSSIIFDGGCVSQWVRSKKSDPCGGDREIKKKEKSVTKGSRKGRKVSPKGRRGSSSEFKARVG